MQRQSEKHTLYTKIVKTFTLSQTKTTHQLMTILFRALHTYIHLPHLREYPPGIISRGKSTTQTPHVVITTRV